MIRSSIARCATYCPTAYSSAKRARDGNRAPTGHSAARIRFRRASAISKYAVSRGIWSH